MDINNRVVTIISKVAQSKKEFSEVTGISTVILSHISSGRNKVSLSAVQQILKAYKNINSEWLIMGKGQMFKDGLETTKVEEIIRALDKTQEDMKQHFRSVDSNITELKKMIKD